MLMFGSGRGENGGASGPGAQHSFGYVSTGSAKNRHLQPDMGQTSAYWWSLAGSNR
jgi:hypothetical protein